MPFHRSPPYPDIGGLPDVFWGEERDRGSPAESTAHPSYLHWKSDLQRGGGCLEPSGLRPSQAVIQASYDPKLSSRDETKPPFLAVKKLKNRRQESLPRSKRRKTCFIQKKRKKSFLLRGKPRPRSLPLPGAPMIRKNRKILLGGKRMFPG